MEQVRTFIAVELPDEIRDGLRRFQEELRGPIGGLVRWVNPEGIHLTLKFLGGVPMETLGAIQDALTRSAAGLSPFKLRLGKPGVFPNERSPRVVWVGVEGDLDRLGILQRRIEEKTGELGFKIEERPFTPHLTLGRVRETASPLERRRLGELVVNNPFESSAAFQVTYVSLMRSTLLPSGVVYDRIFLADLISTLSTSSP